MIRNQPEFPKDSFQSPWKNVGLTKRTLLQVVLTPMEPKEFILWT